MRLVVLGRELLLHALLELAEDLLERYLAALVRLRRHHRLLLHLGLELLREVEELLLVGEEARLVDRGRRRRGRRRRLELVDRPAARHLVRERASELRVEHELEVLGQDVLERGARLLRRRAARALEPRTARGHVRVARILRLERLET